MSHLSKYSRIGIISFVLAVVLWLYFLLLTGILYSKAFAAVLPQDAGFALDFLGFLIFVFFYLGIPGIGFFAGGVLGIISLTKKNSKKLFAILGTILSFLPFVIVIIYNLI